MTLIDLRNVCVSSRGTQLLGPLSLEIPDKTVTAIGGRNGAGKSTLLRVIHKLADPDEGTVHYCAPSLRVALVFQKPLMLMATVLENVCYPMKCEGASREAREYQALELLREAGLVHLAKRAATRLSGGEQQRVAICRALASGPRVLMLDEPTSSLDRAATEFLKELLGKLRRKMALVLVSHDDAFSECLADRSYVLESGRLHERR